MSLPLVSVIIPIYKVEKYIRECVESVQLQSYRNLEIILVDDGSPDNCPAICDECARSDERIKVIHKKNGGLSSARNAGLDVASGKYVMFTDSDDFVDKNMVEDLLTLAEEKNLDVVGSSIKKYYRQQTVIIPNGLTSEITIFQNQEALKWMLLTKIDVASWNKLFKRSAIGSHRFSLNRYNEDVIFLFYLYLDKVKVGYTKTAYYNYRTTEGSLTQTFSKKKFDVLSNADEMQEYLKQINEVELYNLMDVYQDICRTNILMLMIRHKVKCVFWEEYADLSAYVRKHYFRILFGKNYSLKIKIKVLFLVCYTIRSVLQNCK